MYRGFFLENLRNSIEECTSETIEQHTGPVQWIETRKCKNSSKAEQPLLELLKQHCDLRFLRKKICKVNCEGGAHICGESISRNWIQNFLNILISNDKAAEKLLFSDIEKAIETDRKSIGLVSLHMSRDVFQSLALIIELIFLRFEI